MHSIAYNMFHVVAMSGNGHQNSQPAAPKNPNRKFMQDGGIQPSLITNRQFSDIGWKHVHFSKNHHLISRPRFLKLQSSIHEDTCTKLLIGYQQHSTMLGKSPHSTVHEAEHTNLFPSGFSRGCFEQRFRCETNGMDPAGRCRLMVALVWQFADIIWRYGGTIIEFAHMPTHIYPMNPTGNFLSVRGNNAGFGGIWWHFQLATAGLVLLTSWWRFPMGTFLNWMVFLG